MGKFYAVLNGKVPGIYTTWEDCKKQVHGFSGAVFKSFKSKEDAEKFINGNNKRKRESSDILNIDNSECPKRKKRKKGIEIFTDGGCKDNGTKNAIAGIGVYFGQGDDRNVSKRIEGFSTNNRAELIAVLEALKIVKNAPEDVEINTDSDYCIKGITGENKIKKNKDLFSLIFEVMKKGKGKITFKKVSAHSGLKDGNYHADLLATLAISQK